MTGNGQAGGGLTRGPPGPNGVGPGAKGTVTVSLTPGTYVMVCHIPSAQDGIAHSQKGVVGSFTVTGAPPAAPAAPMSTAGTIRIVKGGYEVPANLASGKWRVQNDFDQPAEAALVRLRPGAVAKDVLAFFGGEAPPGPPPFTAVGGARPWPRAAAPSSISR